MREMRELYDAVSLSSQQNGSCCSFTPMYSAMALWGAQSAGGMWNVKACSNDLRCREEEEEREEEERKRGGCVVKIRMKLLWVLSKFWRSDVANLCIKLELQAGAGL